MSISSGSPALADEDIERIARRTAEIFSSTSSARPWALVDPATLAEMLGVRPQWVREHADELEAVRLGRGPKAPMRFDPGRAIQLLSVRRETARPQISTRSPRGRSTASRQPQRRVPLLESKEK